MPDAADLEALRPVADALKELDIPFYVGGSVASNVYGVWRSTVDTDLIAAIGHPHIEPLVKRLEDEFYISAEMIRDAIHQHGSFNVIHLNTAQKVDIFVAGRRPYDVSVRARVRENPVSADRSYTLPVASPEDIVLSKLEWYRIGGEISQRQWTDIRGVIDVQGDQLDWKYMRRWAAELGVDDLLNKAQAEAEFNTD